MKANYLEEFKKKYNVSRAVYWNEKTESFEARSYSATTIAIETQNAFDKFKSDRLSTTNNPSGNLDELNEARI